MCLYNSKSAPSGISQTAGPWVLSQGESPVLKLGLMKPIVSKPVFMAMTNFLHFHALVTVVTSATIRTTIHPLPFSHSRSILERLISICQPPSITTILFSPCNSGHVHCIVSENAKSGCSIVTNGISP